MKALSDFLLPLVACLWLFSAAGPFPPPAPAWTPEFARPGDGPAGLPASLLAAADSIGTARVAAHIAFLADPRREGRGLGSKGLDAAAEYAAAQLRAAGLAPLGPSYFQPVPLREVLPGGGAMSLAGAELRGGRDAVLPRTGPGAISGEAVFAGYAIREPSMRHDDLAGLDVKGKIVVFLSGVPDGAAWQRPELLDKYASKRAADRYDARLELLEELGAKAAVALEPGLARRIAEGKERPERYFLPAGGSAGEGPPLARADLTPGLLARLRAPGPLSAELEVTGEVRPASGRNVLAVLPGADPALRGEAVLIGAHMDHIGVLGGAVNPGADDNASGVSALLEMARAAAAAGNRPARTLVFAFWTGEEEGKFGSDHYVREPAWPLSATRAYLNLDMIGHPWTRAELDALAKAARRPQPWLAAQSPAEFAELGLPYTRPGNAALLARAARGTGMTVHFDWTDGRSGGSDYRAFARRGVPFVRFFGDYFPGYHSPADTAAALDAGQVTRMARLALASAWLLADE